MDNRIGEQARQAMFGCPARDYAVVPPPPKAPPRTWPIPAPDVIIQAIDTPLRGLWIDHVPTGAELAAAGLLYIRSAERAKRHPLAT